MGDLVVQLADGRAGNYCQLIGIASQCVDAAQFFGDFSRSNALLVGCCRGLRAGLGDMFERRHYLGQGVVGLSRIVNGG